ncbi:uncharacterized protein LOC126050896 [Accipiter gentilis]|uniref:uncharacterized protein LOC126050896 n=1 Tax=Astur gentilis TaxID=8957 RepID=UPI0021104BBE|nr:uncharacterized protein LOC126050896 [Accipiter gentilis]
MQHPQGEKGEKMENPTTSTMAMQTPTTSTVAAPTTTTGTVTTPTPVTDTAAKPENQPVPVSVAPVQKKKHTKKSVRLARDEDEPGSSREQKEEPEPEIITRSLSMSELCDMRKDFSHHPGEHIVTWLLQCWDSGASSVELEGKEAKQLGSLSREGGIDKAIGRKTQVLSLWRRLLLGVVGFWRMHIPNYSQIVSPLYQVTRKKNDFKWGPEQRQAFEQIKREYQ